MLCPSLLSWAKQDEKTRKRHLQSRLFKFVNVDKLSYCLVKNLLNESLICDISEYFDLLNTKMKVLKNRETKIFSVGGKYTGASVKAVFSLNRTTNIGYPDLPIRLDFHRTLKINNFVYCIGGRINKSSASNQVLRLNLNEVDMNWNKITEMNDKRCSHGAAVFKKNLVVCGGYDGRKLLSSSEVYEPELNMWTPISSLKQGRNENQSVTSGGCLYTMGGFKGKNILSSVERLDGLHQSWKSVSSMQIPRGGFAAVSCNDVIYAIGGISNNYNILKSVEKYDCATNKWIYVSKMNIARQRHSACVMQGKIFVVGGRNAEHKLVKEIECYDPSTDKWEVVSGIDDELIAHSLVAL